jgi:hypothetical protein
LLGIVSQLEEAQQEPSELADEPATFGPEDRFDTEAEPDPEPFGTSPRTSAGIPSDDPRRDPLLPEIPRFVPPDLPKFVPAPAGDETIEAITPAEFPVPAPTEAPADTSAAEEVAQLEADSGLPRPSAAEIDGIDPPESGSSEIQAAATVEAPPEMEADLAEATPAIDEEAEESLDPSFLGWTTEEEGGAVDLSLPDFPTIDLPTLEDEGRNRN